MKITKAKLKCVNCGAESEQEIVLSSHTFNGVGHLDARFDNGEVKENLQCCPACNYCNFDISAKSKSTKSVMNSTEYQTIARSRLDKNVKEILTAAMVNEQDKKTIEAGRLYRAASWIFEDKKDTKNANKYRELAIQNLIKNIKKDESGHLAMQCVDMLRKSKRFDEAQKLLDDLKKEMGLSLMEIYFNDPNVNFAELASDQEISTMLKIAKFEQQLLKNKDFADHLMSEI